VRLFRRSEPPIPSPNIWHWPDVYERENAAQDVDGAIWAALRELAPWAGRDVLDVGCGDGFHLPVFAAEAASVTGVEPYVPLVERARARVGDSATVLLAGAAELPLPDRSVDLVHARTAYFFGPGCEPGLAEARRVLRPGGQLRFLEHVGADGPGAMLRFQRVLDATVWPRLFGGCHCGRDTEAAIRRAGFEVQEVDRFRLPEGSRMPEARMVLGRAVPA
jgi:SAM-dependent methyltransferase